MAGFRTIAVGGQTSVVADSSSDTVTIQPINGITATTFPASDTIQIYPDYGASQNTICEGNDNRLYNSRTPLSHSTSHRAGGSDSIKLDTLDAPDDVTTLNASTARHGLLRKLSGTPTQFLNGAGNWTVPQGAQYVELAPLGGTSDDGPQIQAAVDALPNGGFLRLGPGHFRIDSAVVIDSAIIIQGAGWREGPTPGAGTWITIYATGFAPFTFTGVEARGAIVRDIAVWQQHAWGGGTPTDYDYVFKVIDCFGGVSFSNIFLLCVNKGLMSLTSGRMLVEKLYGDIYRIGVYFENALDACRMSDCHFWPFAGETVAHLAFKQANGIPVYLGRADGVFITDLFTFGYLASISCEGNITYGSNTTVFVSSLYSDFCKYAVRYGANAANSKLFVDTILSQHELYLGNGSPGAPVPESSAIFVGCTGVTVRIGSLSVERCDTSAIRCTSTNMRLYIGSLTVDRYSQPATTDPVISLASPGTCTTSLATAPDFLNEYGHLNYVRSIPTQSGGRPTIEAQGKDAVVDIEAKAKGDYGAVVMSSNGIWSSRFDAAPSATNSFLFRAENTEVKVVVEGVGANCDIGMYPVGTGRLRFGAHVASGDVAITGYIEVKDASGVVRRLAVVG